MDSDASQLVHLVHHMYYMHYMNNMCVPCLLDWQTDPMSSGSVHM